jgi:uncharacterized membrane protein
LSVKGGTFTTLMCCNINNEKYGDILPLSFAIGAFYFLNNTNIYILKDTKISEKRTNTRYVDVEK